MAELLPSSFDHVELLRPFAAVRLIAADLDGTLLPSTLVEKVQVAIRSLSSYGVRFTLATGRTFCGVRELSERLGLAAETPLVLYNGSVVREAGTARLLRRSTVPIDVAREIIRRASTHQCEVFAYFCLHPLEACSSSQLPEERVAGWRFGESTEARAEREFNGCAIAWQDDTFMLAQAPSAILVRASMPETLSAITEKLLSIPSISVTRSGPIYLEVRPAESNKGSALAFVAAHLSLTKDEVLAVGDNDNDAEMLAWAGVGVAVAGASAAAQANADYVCRHSVFQGAVEMLHIVRQAHRFFGTRKRKRAVVS